MIALPASLNSEIVIAKSRRRARRRALRENFSVFLTLYFKNNKLTGGNRQKNQLYFSLSNNDLHRFTRFTPLDNIFFKSAFDCRPSKSVPLWNSAQSVVDVFSLRAFLRQLRVLCG